MIHFDVIQDITIALTSSLFLYMVIAALKAFVKKVIK